MKRRRRWLLAAAVATVTLAGLSVVYVWTDPLLLLPTHAHCIRAAGVGFHNYADQHDGEWPYHPKGYGNALLLMDEELYYALTGPGYDAAPFHEAKRTGTDLAEEDCGRVYIQGVMPKPNCGSANIVVLFDKLPTRGGDHMHFPGRLWSPLGREVCYGDASSRFIKEEDWPDFAKEQIELLVGEGVQREEAERLYASKPKLLP
jgi:hypothetical protein